MVIFLLSYRFSFHVTNSSFALLPLPALLLGDPFGLPAIIGYAFPGTYIPLDGTYPDWTGLITGLAPPESTPPPPLDEFEFMKACI